MTRFRSRLGGAAALRRSAAVVAVLGAHFAGAAAARAGVDVTPIPEARTSAAATPMPMRVVGRVLRRGASDYVRQWPGGYFETAFEGAAVDMRVGPGEVALHVTVDDQPPVALVKPEPGLYRIGGLSAGRHRVRVEVVSESQAGPTVFGGFWAEPGDTPLSSAPRERQIEFIGDSHTVGYGNTSARRECTTGEVWATTDTSQGIGPDVARHYDADYQVNAISGRGAVRNYNGFAADTLPEAYPFTLFDKQVRWSDPAWRPRLVVIALGTNDFSTPLRPGERWKSRAALHADYEATYAAFVEDLRARYPQAYFVLWATDMAQGEIEAEVRAVVERLHRDGERRVGFVPVHGLALGACNSHPTVEDDRAIAGALTAFVDARPDIWSKP